MILCCPKCNRRYRLNATFQDKYLRCVCSAVLRVSGNSNITTQQKDKPVQTIISDQNTDAKFTKTESQSIIFPDLTTLLDLSQFGSEPNSEIPQMEQALPSFDDDEFSDESFLDEEDSQDSNARKDSLSNLNIEDKKVLDPRIPSLLHSLNQSQDPKFIVNALYFLLEIKHSAIGQTVQKFTTDPNPLAAYFAKRILQDLLKMSGDEHRKPEIIEPYPRNSIFESLFNGSQQTKTKALDHVIDNLQFGAVPYFICQLLREQNPEVLINFLNRLGLLSNELEIEFFAQFLQHQNLKVKLAAIEGMSGIGGQKVIYYLIPSLIDSNPTIVSAVKVALGTSDQNIIAQQIRTYLRSNDVKDYNGYLQILQSNQSFEGFRSIVWMFENPNIRSKAFEVAQTYEISDESKTVALEEYLLLSFDDSVFANQIIEYLELINTSYDRARLIPNNVFDDSYIELVRLSPLFVKDFHKEDDGEIDGKEETHVRIPIFKLTEVLLKPGKRIKSEIENTKRLLKTKSILTFTISQLVLYSSLGFLCFLALIRGMGTNKSGLPSTLMPNKLQTTDGLLVFEDPMFKSALAELAGIAIIVIFGAWVIGSFIAIAQLKKGNKNLRFLPLVPILVSPLIIGFTLGSIEFTLPSLIPVKTLLLAGFLFPCISIFYIIYTRMFQLVPDSQLQIARLLGAKDDVAFTLIYGPFYLVGTIFSVMLNLLYIYSGHAMGFFTKSNQALGFIVLKKLEFPEGYLMMGAYAFPIIICAILSAIFIESLIPVACFFPMGTARPPRHPVYKQLEEWMALLGSVLYSISCYRKPKGQIAEEPPKADTIDVVHTKETKDVTPEPIVKTPVTQPQIQSSEDDYDDFED